jgi:hypothetical protein
MNPSFCDGSVTVDVIMKSKGIDEHMSGLRGAQKNQKV